MKTSQRTIVLGGIFAIALGLILPIVAATPAQAAARCSNIGSDGTYATANCTGTGYVRLNVRCNAIWPYTPWTDYGTRTYISGAGNVINAHIYCGATLTTWVTYG